MKVDLLVVRRDIWLVWSSVGLMAMKMVEKMDETMAGLTADLSVMKWVAYLVASTAAM